MVTAEKRPNRRSDITEFLVKVDGKVVGMITRLMSTRHPHPWRAWLGIGPTVRYLDSFYDRDGGFASALRAVEDA